MDVRQLTVQLLKRELLGLADEAEDHTPGDEVEAGVETDCVGVSKGEFPGARCGCNLQAPVWVKTRDMRGKVKLRIPAERMCVSAIV